MDQSRSWSRHLSAGLGIAAAVTAAATIPNSRARGITGTSVPGIQQQHHRHRIGSRVRRRAGQRTFAPGTAIPASSCGRHGSAVTSPAPLRCTRWAASSICSCLRQARLPGAAGAGAGPAAAPAAAGPGRGVRPAGMGGLQPACEVSRWAPRVHTVFWNCTRRTLNFLSRSYLWARRAR